MSVVRNDALVPRPGQPTNVGLPGSGLLAPLLTALFLVVKEQTD